MSTDSPTSIGPYNVIRSLGAGGMGEVFLAYDPRLKRQVAIKRIRPDAVGDPEHQARLRREAQLAAGLNHPAIVHVHDLLNDGGVDHIVMELVSGPTLRQRIKQEGAFSLAEGLRLARALTEGLAYAHRQGVVHRDLKTENVLLTDSGQPKITDFGIARRLLPQDPAATKEETLTRSGSLLGTYRAMSPEQICGDPVDARSDLFSLGVLLYEIFTARSPFLAETNLKTIQHVLHHDPVPVRELVPELPAELGELIEYLVEKDPLLRPRHAGEVADRLRALAATSASETEVLTLVDGDVEAQRKAPPRPNGMRWVWLVIGFLLLVGVALAIRRCREVPEEAKPLLYVAVMEPSFVPDMDDEAAGILRLAVYNGILRTLVSLEGVSPIAPDRTGDLASSPAAVALAEGADEVIRTTLACKPPTCLVGVERLRKDGTVLWNDEVEDVRLDEPLHATQWISLSIREAYRFLEIRVGADTGFEIEPADYAALLDAQRELAAGSGSVAPDKLLGRTEVITRSSPRFTGAYLLEAQVAMYIYQNTQEPALLDQAFDRITEAQKLAPGDPEILLSRAHCEILADRLDDAEATLEAVEKIVPGHVFISQTKARIARRRGQPERALKLFREAIEKKPSAGLLIDYGRFAWQQGEVEEARWAIREHLRLLPGSAKGKRLLAPIELNSGNPAGAIALVEDLATASSSPIDPSLVGLGHLLLGHYSEAARAFEEAVSRAPKSPIYLLNLADARWLEGRTGDAEVLYRDVLSVPYDDEDWQHLSVRAQALAHLGEKYEAVSTIQQALQKAPGNRDVVFEAALVYTLVGDRNSALVRTREALAMGQHADWFALPWFDSLRSDPDFQRLLPQRTP